MPGLDRSLPRPAWAWSRCRPDLSCHAHRKSTGTPPAVRAVGRVRFVSDDEEVRLGRGRQERVPPPKGDVELGCAAASCRTGPTCRDCHPAVTPGAVSCIVGDQAMMQGIAELRDPGLAPPHRPAHPRDVPCAENPGLSGRARSIAAKIGGIAVQVDRRVGVAVVVPSDPMRAEATGRHEGDLAWVPPVSRRQTCGLGFEAETLAASFSAIEPEK